MEQNKLLMSRLIQNENNTVSTNVPQNSHQNGYYVIPDLIILLKLFLDASLVLGPEYG